MSLVELHVFVLFNSYGSNLLRVSSVNEMGTSFSNLENVWRDTSHRLHRGSWKWHDPPVFAKMFGKKWADS